MEQHPDFDIGVLCEVLRRRFWWIVTGALAGMMVGAVYASMLSKVVVSSATVKVEAENPSVINTSDITKEDYRQPEDLKTVEQQLCSNDLIWRVIRANNLDQRPGYFKPSWLRSLMGQPISQSDMIAALAKNIEVKLRRGTRLIDITVKQKDDRKTAQTLVRSLIDTFISMNAEWRINPSKEGDKTLIEEAERLKKNLGAAELALQDYREKHRAVSLEEKQNIVVDRLKDLNLRVAKAQNEALSLESDLAQLDKLGQQPGRILGIGSIANAQSVLDVRKVLTEKEAAFALLRQRYGPENPAYAQAERELQQLRATLDVTVLNAADSLRTQSEAAKLSQQMAEKMLLEQEQLALELNKKATQYNALSREVASDRALLDAVVNRIKETAVSKHFNELNVHLIDPPMLGEPKTLFTCLLFVVMGTFGGSALAFGGVIGLQIARPLIQLPDQAVRVLGIPVLGAILRMAAIKGDARRIPCIKEPRSPAAEAFRFLVACTEGVAGVGEKSTLLFTSPSRGTGSTSCATGYAIALAQTGVRTLLVDANLRNPQIGRLFSIPSEALGFADCLANRAGLEAAVAPTKVENLFVLVAGAVPPNLSGLFAQPVLSGVMGKALEAFGRIVIDSAPVNIASETLVLARHVTSVCLVLRSGTASIREASHACELLERAGRAPIGMILNRVPQRTLV